MTSSNHLLVRGLAVFVGALLAPCVASAQSPAGTSAIACTYATCALRIEPTLFGNKLVRGAGAEKVAQLGGFGGGIDVLLSGPDSAAAYGRQYVHDSKVSGVLGGIGFLTYIVVAARTDNFRRTDSGGDLAVLFGGAAALVASAPFQYRARRELSRAVWWYNEALPR